VPWVAPKFDPETVMAVPAEPEVGDNAVIDGAPETVNVTPLLFVPPVVTTTGPVLAPTGTGTRMLVSLQLIGVPVVVLIFTTLVPCGEPKPEPVIVTFVLMGPVVGEMLLMVGGPLMVKFTPLLATPPTVTMTGPVVAPVGTGTTIWLVLQLDGVAAVPLKVTVLLPLVVPKFDPVMVIEVPTLPLAGNNEATLGAGTVK
jgi:hypothetical protein